MVIIKRDRSNMLIGFVQLMNIAVASLGRFARLRPVMVKGICLWRSLLDSACRGAVPHRQHSSVEISLWLSFVRFGQCCFKFDRSLYNRLHQILIGSLRIKEHSLISLVLEFYFSPQLHQVQALAS